MTIKALDEYARASYDAIICNFKIDDGSLKIEGGSGKENPCNIIHSAAKAASTPTSR
jgi:hypothetical protein